MTHHRPGVIRRVLTFFWRSITWIRVSLTNVLFLLLVAFVISALLPEDSATMPEKTALRIAPSGFLVDQYSYIDPLTEILEQTSNSEQAETLVRDLVTALHSARDDQRITAVVLDLNYLMGGGISKLSEVGNALEFFKSSGKPIYAVSDSYSQEQYYLASYADEILLHPMGSVLLTGYGSYRNYFKSALDKLSLNMHVFRVGEYKDAVEPYLRNSMSEASREHNSQWLNELWSGYTAVVEQQRQLENGWINNYINRIDQHLTEQAGDTAATALALKLVDQLASQPQQQQFLMNKVGTRQDGESYRALDFNRYLAMTQSHNPLDDRPRVGLLVAKGMILDGYQPAGSIGGDSLSQLLRDARNHKDLDALVVRVDSPGGSAFASEVIRQELELTRQQGIPVFISMGSVAASGGYWMSMAADEVWATPNTITGSIGVFSAFPTLENTLEKMGVSTDGIGTTELAGAMRIDRPMTDLAKDVMQQSVNHIYNQFIHIVAESRQTTSAKVHAVGQGRVWTGRAALDLGLVDQLGDLHQVIAAAAEKIGASDYQVIEIQKPLSPTEMLVKQIRGELASYAWLPQASHNGLFAFLQKVEKELSPLVDLLTSADPRSVFAHCLDCSTL